MRKWEGLIPSEVQVRGVVGWLRVLSCASVLLWAPAAAAQTDADELGRRHFQAATSYFEQAEYEQALREFTRAYELSGRPEILLNIATVNERLGQWDEAVSALDKYLEQRPDDEHAATLKIRRDNLKKRADQQREEEASEPPPTDETAGESTPPTAPAEPPAPSPPAQQEPTIAPEPNRLPAYIFFAVGGATAIGSIVTGIFAQAEHSDLEESCAPNCTDDEVSSGEALALTSTVLTGVAVVSTAVGAYFWFNPGKTTEGSTAPEINVALAPGSARAAARWRF